MNNRSSRRRKKRDMTIRIKVGLGISILLVSIVIFNVNKFKIENEFLKSEGTSINDIEVGNNNISQNDSEYEEEKEKENGESINTAIKSDLAYTSFENDIFADNAKDIEHRLTKWNYLREDGKKIAYLTFDDGPSTKVTPQILNVLKSNDIKATFFVLGSNVEKGEEQKELLKQMVKDGHAIGNHGYCHDYSKLYPGRVADTNVFIEDINRSENVLKGVLGQEFSSKVIRFPGGHMSWKTSELDVVLQEQGYSYIDWNALNGDAEGNGRTTEQLLARVKNSISELAGNDDVLVLLMHDTNAKETTAESLQATIDYLKSLGYEFRTLK